ncbi:MAG: hypothetical protein BWY85_02268 [Firmicutes bacterium ADurb.Bin506]|nr:MAG: hypothetical protein BWY85_02268 [Firmicutes bacterium ADurb.Bin506]
MRVTRIRLAIALAMITLGIAAALVAAQFVAGMELVVTAEGTRVLYSSPVSPGDEFSIVYTHSVQRSPVVEKFRVLPDGNIVVFETIYQDFGAGLPSDVDEGAKVVVEPGGVRIYDMNRVMPRITLRVGSIARHQFRHDTTVINLADLLDSGTRVDITVKP